MIVNGLTLPASFERFIDRPDVYSISCACLGAMRRKSKKRPHD
jgi:hypothetical protein